MSLAPPQQIAIAVNRFGLGARPDEPLPADPQRWLLDQLGHFDPRPAPLAAITPATPLARDYRAAALDKKQAKLQAEARMQPGAMDGKDPSAPGLAATPDALGARDALQEVRRRERDRYRGAVNARMQTALLTPTPFVERLAAFWSNHFAISMDKGQVGIYAPDFELEAIRPHVLGRFADMLLAVEHHPAMLFYLDQTRSIGPDSVIGQRNAGNPDKKRGLNENLAREIMELHTLGVRTGYTQADVTEFARALTGWSFTGDQPGSEGDVAFTFRPAIHQPGARTIVGKRYPEGGEEQGRAVLLDFAASPATARHLATKLARHFVADDPPPALVDGMAAAYLRSGGDLPTVYRTLIAAPEAWTQPIAKFKTPWDWSASTLRGLGRRDLGHMDMAPMLTQLGQTVWKPGQPVGYDDMSASWAAPDALMRRVELAQRFAAIVGPEVDARALAPKLLPGTLTPATAAELGRAESGPTALALLLVSPEFQRR